MVKDGSLTPRQKRFVEEYLIDLNGGHAAERAGYSPKSARQQASYLLRKPKIKRAVAAARDIRAERTQITQDRVLEELALIAFADMAEFVDWSDAGIAVRSRERLSEGQTRAIAEVSGNVTGTGGTVKVKLHDKRGALVDIGKHLGMFKSLHEHTGPDGKPIRFEDVNGLSDLERAHRIAALLERARARRAGQAPDGGDADLGTADEQSSV